MVKRIALPFALVLAGGLTVAACGDDDSSVFDGASQTTAATASETTEAAEPDEPAETSGTEDSISNPLDDLPTPGSVDSDRIADMLENIYADMGLDLSREQVECLVDEMGLDEIGGQSDASDVMEQATGNIWEIMQTCDIDPTEMTEN